MSALRKSERRQGVATQSFVDPNYGKLALDLMRGGKSASDALRPLLTADDAPQLRQVAMIDAQGRVAAHTGDKNIPEAGHRVGTDYSVQANLMLNDGVWPAMARAFEAAKGDLADRMLAALDAAQAASGDIRGRQSAALIVVTANPLGSHGWTVSSTSGLMIVPNHSTSFDFWSSSSVPTTT
jgi:uncharacterized Ntn-hydrolase superfamily protein